MPDHLTTIKRHIAAMTQLDRMFEQEDAPAEGGNASGDVDDDILESEVAEAEREFEE